HPRRLRAQVPVHRRALAGSRPLRPRAGRSARLTLKRCRAATSNTILCGNHLRKGWRSGLALLRRIAGLVLTVIVLAIACNAAEALEAISVPLDGRTLDLTKSVQLFSQ